LVDGNGMPLSVHATSASADERQQVAILLQKVRVYHGYGRPKHCPHEIHADKGYDSKALRNFIRKKGLKPVIPHRKWKNRRMCPGPKVPPSKDRWKVERCFSWMERKFRRLNVRWERRSKYWQGFLQLSIIFIWLEKIICG
jgi:transposase